MGSVDDVIAKIKKDGIEFVYLQFTDMLGAVKTVTITADKVEEALEKGVWFDGSSIEGFARIHESDLFLKPDPDTYAIIPWEGDWKDRIRGHEASQFPMNAEERERWHTPSEASQFPMNADKIKGRTARFICDVFGPDGKPFEGDPRHILRRAIEMADRMGYVYNVGPEPEFFIFKRTDGEISPPTHDKAGYFDFSTDLGTDIRKEIVLALEAMGISVEASHHEVAWGQHEIDFKYDNALRTADNVITFKFAVKEIARRHGLYATFMPKPVFGINGSGMHVHQSLFDIKAGKNAFFDENDKYNLSKIAYSFIAGQMEHIKAMSAILSPLVNSYKRLVPGYEAACYISWAHINRSALIRIPRYSKGREESTRCELRCPDPACNPYLAFAVMLRAGLDGIKKGVVPPEPVEENLFDFDDTKLKKLHIDVLPHSLWQALKEMKNDPLMKDALGGYLYERYINAKTDEWDSFRTSVTDWEKKRYFEML
ncbi:MAG: glutamine synthetase [Candidatus Micrarchaeota archaeon]|nr:glutamine synthetase [Candidatus Micrarchaeota archaeon]